MDIQACPLTNQKNICKEKYFSTCETNMIQNLICNNGSESSTFEECTNSLKNKDEICIYTNLIRISNAS